MRVLSVVGARPQFVKASAVSSALERAGVAEFLVHTGQHYDAAMSEQFFSELELRAPDVNLGVGSGPHGWQTAQMMLALEPIIEQQAPEWVLVYGDTNSTLAAALTARKLNVPVAHVEAGLRSFNLRMPEEINRRVADSVSDLLLAPTDVAVANLQNEGVPESRIKLVGDVMFDVALRYAKKGLQKSRIVEQLGLATSDYILVTIHRAENTDCAPRLASLAAALRELSHSRTVVFPVHPRTRKELEAMNLLDKLGECRLIGPIGYLDMVSLESRAALIVTDSGGVQKEAFFHQRPCVTLRDETEWVELIDLGWNRLCDISHPETIINCVTEALGSRGREAFPYGDGKAAEKIVALLQTH